MCKNVLRRWIVEPRWTVGFLCLVGASACAQRESATTQPMQTQDTVGVLVVDGNSWTQSRHGAVPMPQNVWKQLGSPENLRIVDEAESGIGMAEMVDARHQQRVDSHVTPGQLNVLILWEGCHDLAEGLSAEETARRLREDGSEEQVRGTELRVGDLVVVEAGQVIPGDGDVVEGVATVDESAITGESAPVIRESGGDRDRVDAGSDRARGYCRHVEHDSHGPGSYEPRARV